ncbi:hypothetical protein OU995_21165 [Roseateles sp. SL47]|nr:hypothetical protein [Roseateles sp. SL47]WAC72056.1 hypothetical protein OU995_21165 [Roseateles sp. SL47]
MRTHTTTAGARAHHLGLGGAEEVEAVVLEAFATFTVWAVIPPV